MHANKTLALVLLGSALAFGAPACTHDVVGPDEVGEAELAIKTPLDTPTLSATGSTQTSISVQVCAGPSGAPAGFSVQWETQADYAANGWNDTDPTYCAASFSGVPGGSSFSLGANECTTVDIGALDPSQIGLSFNDGCNAGLVCGTTYVFRSFAHAVPQSDWSRSDFSATITASTAACSDGCTFTQGYWKTHDGSPNPNVWPVSSLSLGSVSYSEAQLSSIFDQAVAGNGLVALAHQLMAAKLNIANGASSTSISSTIAASDALIGGLVVPPVGSGSLSPSSTSALVAALTSYNEGTTGPGHCE